MQSNYFHAAPIPLKPGSVIEPGNWGRVIKATRFNNGGLPMFYIRELVFENVRLREFPALPSRFESAFVFETAEAVIQFANGDGTRRDLCYEVEMVDPQANSHAAAINLVRDGQIGEFAIPFWENLAGNYWRGMGEGTREILTLSSLRIVKRVPE